MKSDDQLLHDMEQQKHQASSALRGQSTREVELFLDYIEKEHIAPDTRYFSITKMKIIPLWTIYRWYGYDDQAAFVSSAGKLYEFRGMGYIAPASRYGRLHIGETLANMREAREKQQAAEAVAKKRRSPWCLLFR